MKLRVKTRIRAGGTHLGNHNARKALRVKTRIRAGTSALNHNARKALRVR